MSDNKELTIEERFSELENIISCLSNTDTPLDEAFSLYEKGVKLVAECTESLDLVEKKILVLRDNAANTEE